MQERLQQRVLILPLQGPWWPLRASLAAPPTTRRLLRPASRGLPRASPAAAPAGWPDRACALARCATRRRTPALLPRGGRASQDRAPPSDRMSVVTGKRVAVSVGPGGPRHLHTKTIPPP